MVIFDVWGIFLSGGGNLRSDFDHWYLLLIKTKISIKNLCIQIAWSKNENGTGAMTTAKNFIWVITWKLLFSGVRIDLRIDVDWE